MKRTLLCLTMIFLTAAIIQAQSVPAKIKSLVNKSYTGWKPAPGFCVDKKSWFLRGDFNGDNQKDYVLRVKTGKTAKNTKLHLVAFINTGKGNYQIKKIADESYTGDLLRSTFAIMKKGEQVSLGEGDGETITLKTDAVTQYICETDASKIFIYKEGDWKNIYEP